MNSLTLITVVSLLVGCCCAQDEISRIGNPIRGSASGVDVPGSTFLLKDVVLTEGVLFAYSAFFRSDARVRFQVWRPVNNDPDPREFDLVAETPVIPSVVYGREDVYIESKLTESCVSVQTGDRLGVFQEEIPGAISYTFNAVNPRALAHTLENVTETHNIGDIVTFDSLTFPYDFSLSAFIYESNTAIIDPVSGCPQHVLIPDFDDQNPETTTRVPITGAPGATGPTGRQGEQGEQGLQGEQGEQGEQGIPGPTGPAGTDQGTQGEQGEQGPEGEEGPEGGMGATGPHGPTGEQGETGPEGARGPAGPVVTIDTPVVAAQDDDEGIFSDPMMILILLIWLFVVTVVIVIIIIVLCCIRRRRRKQNEHTKLVTTAGDSAHSDDIYTNYSLDAVNRQGGEKAGTTNVAYVSETADDDASSSTNMKDVETTGYSNGTITRDGKDAGDVTYADVHKDEITNY